MNLMILLELLTEGNMLSNKYKIHLIIGSMILWLTNCSYPKNKEKEGFRDSIVSYRNGVIKEVYQIGLNNEVVTYSLFDKNGVLLNKSFNNRSVLYRYYFDTAIYDIEYTRIFKFDQSENVKVYSDSGRVYSFKLKKMLLKYKRCGDGFCLIEFTDQGIVQYDTIPNYKELRRIVKERLKEDTLVKKYVPNIEDN